eukprot:scaffold291502_cov14-Tisochrysis_lutea.AAC.1
MAGHFTRSTFWGGGQGICCLDLKFGRENSELGSQRSQCTIWTHGIVAGYRKVHNLKTQHVPLVLTVPPHMLEEAIQFHCKVQMHESVR